MSFRCTRGTKNALRQWTQTLQSMPRDKRGVGLQPWCLRNPGTSVPHKLLDPWRAVKPPMDISNPLPDSLSYISPSRFSWVFFLIVGLVKVYPLDPFVEGPLQLSRHDRVYDGQLLDNCHRTPLRTWYPIFSAVRRLGNQRCLRVNLAMGVYFSVLPSFWHHCCLSVPCSRTIRRVRTRVRSQPRFKELVSENVCIDSPNVYNRHHH